MFRNSPVYHFVVGTLWLVVAVLTAIKNPMYVGSVYWPPILLGAVGVFDYVWAIVLIVKNRRQSRKK